MRSFGPLGREGDDANEAACRGLQPVELINIGRAHVGARMSAARAVFPGNVGTLHVEPRNRLSVRDDFPRVRQIAQAGLHFLSRPGDHRGVDPRGSAGELRFQRACDLLVRRVRVIVIDAGEAVDLKVDESGRQVEVLRPCRDNTGDGFAEGELDRQAGQRVDAGTLL